MLALQDHAKRSNAGQLCLESHPLRHLTVPAYFEPRPAAERQRYVDGTTDDAEAKRIADESAARDALAAQRFKDQKPTPGAEAAIRQSIADILAWQPKYGRVSPRLADVTRQQLAELKAIFVNLGTIKSVTFKRVEKSAADVYDIEFEHGLTEWRITIAPDRTIENLVRGKLLACVPAHRSTHLLTGPDDLLPSPRSERKLFAPNCIVLAIVAIVNG